MFNLNIRRFVTPDKYFSSELKPNVWDCVPKRAPNTENLFLKMRRGRARSERRPVASVDQELSGKSHDAALHLASNFSRRF